MKFFFATLRLRFFFLNLHLINKTSTNFPQTQKVENRDIDDFLLSTL